MGERGPAPGRSEEKLGNSKPALEVRKLNTKEILEKVIEIPLACESWHPVAIYWFESLGDSAQSVYYEPSDWALAYTMAESLSRDLKPQVVGVTPGHYDEGREAYVETEVTTAYIPLKGSSLGAYMKVMEKLLVTEVDRRRAGIEITRPQLDTPVDAPDGVTNMDDYRDSLTG